MPPVVKISADCMTVKQTSEWIRSLGRYYNWNQADAYAEIFVENEIWGHLLQMITFEMLKVDLNIIEADHRQKIMMAIWYMFPSMATSEDSDMMEVDQRMSPMLHSSRMVSPRWVNMMNISRCGDS